MAKPTMHGWNSLVGANPDLMLLHGKMRLSVKLLLESWQRTLRPPIK
jgi:hypothetical protein